MEHQLRRVVTGHDADGKSRIVMDGQPATVTRAGPEPERVLFEVWSTAATPPTGRTGLDAAEALRAPEPSASEIRVVDLPPGQQREMHRTDTLDYGIVLAGQVYLVLETEETLLRAGDVVVQRGTYHAWHNRSDRTARLAFINLKGQFTDEPRCP
jgi:quercetin dioxygenase-like cupin family protein